MPTPPASDTALPPQTLLDTLRRDLHGQRRLYQHYRMLGLDAVAERLAQGIQTMELEAARIEREINAVQQA